MKDIVFVLPFVEGSSNSFLCWNEIASYQFVFIDMPGRWIEANTGKWKYGGR